LTVALSVIYNGWRAERKDGKPAGDQIMRLTTKLLKDIIKEELDNMSEDTSLEEEIEENKDAIELGAPVNEEEQATNEGIENITPENIMLVLQALAKMGVELSPALLGGGVVAAAMKIKDAMQDQEVDDDPRFYDDED
jgi:hypothetical protein